MLWVVSTPHTGTRCRSGGRPSHQGSIKRAGSPVGNLTGGSITYSNNLEKIETIRDDGLTCPAPEVNQEPTDGSAPTASMP